jgi:hypothetical protein
VGRYQGFGYGCHPHADDHAGRDSYTHSECNGDNDSVYGNSDNDSVYGNSDSDSDSASGWL